MNKDIIVLVIEDNYDDFLIIKRHLVNEYNLIYNDGQESVEKITDFIERIKPDIILLDYNLGKIKGTDLLINMQDLLAKNTISVIMLTNELKPTVIVECIKCHAGNYLIKDKITKNELLITIEKALSETQLNKIIREQQEEIIKLANFDGLTGLLNRRCFIEKIEDKIKTLTRNNDFISLIILDLDNFKKVNDNFGHHVGDDVLIITAQLLMASLRETDFVARYGGDEFIICLIESFHRDQKIIIENHLNKLIDIMKEIEDDIMDYLNMIDQNKTESMEMGSFDFRVTTSVGMTYQHSERIEFRDLFKEADKNLYISKQNGKNKITYKDPESQEIKILKVAELC